MLKGKRVVIVGAGFAGLHCAQVLSNNPNFSVTLIDRNDYQQFQPLLYQVATGALSTQNAAFNLRMLFEYSANVEVKTSTIVSVDLETKTATGETGDRYEADYLVLAAGSEVNFFNTKGAVQMSYPLYSLRDAERLRSRIYSLLEAADLKHSSAVSQSMSIVVIGGGPTGIETAGAIADLLRLTPHNLYPNVDLSAVSVSLIDSSHALLKPFTVQSQEYAKRVLEERGVNVRLGKRVKEVRKDSVLLDDETSLDATLVIWAGGLEAATLSRAVGIGTGKGGRIDVDGDLTVRAHPNVYALGDFANCRDHDGAMLPQLASVAQQAGRHCAKNIMAHTNGEDRTPFKYVDKGILAMVGRNAGIAEVGPSHFPLNGPFAFAAWLGVHASLLTSFRANLESLVEWTWDYAREIPMNPINDQVDEMGATV